MLEPSPLAAAHSMDTRWFAIDDVGAVAMLRSGATGAVPDTVRPSDDLDADDDSDYVFEFVDTPGERPFVIESDPDNELERYPNEFVARLGVYEYSHEHWNQDVALFYTRRFRPLVPLTVGELPAAVRDRAVRLEGVRFEFAPLLQPLDHVEGRAFENIPFLSLRDWALRDWEENRLVGYALEDSDVPLWQIPGELLRWNLGDAVRSLDAFDAVAAFSNGSVDYRAHAWNILRARGELSLPDYDETASFGERMRAPYSSLAGPPLAVASHELLESLCVNSRLPLSWLADHGVRRRFLCHARDWLDNAQFEDARDAWGAMSLAHLPAELLASLANDARVAVTAERLARDERGSDIVYWRVAKREDIALLRAIRSGVASAREHAIYDIGVALDPVATDVAVLWAAPAQPGTVL